jgi:hypothetical protein
MTGAAAYPQRLDEALRRLRAVSERVPVSGTGAHDELDRVLSGLWAEFAPHEDEERRMAATVGGGAPEMVSMAQRQIHRRLAALNGELRAASRDDDAAQRIARQLGAIEALVEARLETERWLAGRQPEADAGSGTRCEWCGAEYPEPGES